MKILLNELNDFLKFKKKYYNDLKKSCKQQKWGKHSNTYLKLLKQKYIIDCQEILKTELQDDPWQHIIAESYFCSPYSISLWNDNKDMEFIDWNEKIMNISVKKLLKILKNSNKKYLELRCNHSLSGWMQPTVKLEKD